MPSNLKLIMGGSSLDALDGMAYLQPSKKGEYREKLIVNDTSKIVSNVDIKPEMEIFPSAPIERNANFLAENEVFKVPDNNNDIMKYIDLLNQDRRDMEKRLTDDKKESEERINKTIDKIDSKIDVLSGKIEDSNRQFKWWAIGLIAGVIGVVLASSYAIVQIIAQIKGL